MGAAGARSRSSRRCGSPDKSRSARAAAPAAGPARRGRRPARCWRRSTSRAAPRRPAACGPRGQPARGAQRVLPALPGRCHVRGLPALRPEPARAETVGQQHDMSLPCQCRPLLVAGRKWSAAAVQRHHRRRPDRPRRRDQAGDQGRAVGRGDLHGLGAARLAGGHAGRPQEDRRAERISRRRYARRMTLGSPSPPAYARRVSPTRRCRHDRRPISRDPDAPQPP